MSELAESRVADSRWQAVPSQTPTALSAFDCPRPSQTVYDRPFPSALSALFVRLARFARLDRHRLRVRSCSRKGTPLLIQSGAGSSLR